MKYSLLILVLPLLLTGLQNNANAQQDNAGNVLYASALEVKAPVASTRTPKTTDRTGTIATLPVASAYNFNNCYAAESFEVYAGEEQDLSLFYLKVTTSFITPVTIKVVNSDGQEITHYLNVNHPLAIGYGYKPGLYFIHVIQGKKEMVLRFFKGV